MNVDGKLPRLTSYKKDNGYKLHLDNHISNVAIAKVADTDTYTPHFYVKATCILETIQTETPCPLGSSTYSWTDCQWRFLCRVSYHQ
jgi:hypothetical protein